MTGCPTHNPFVLASSFTWLSLVNWLTLLSVCMYNIVWHVLCGSFRAILFKGDYVYGGRVMRICGSVLANSALRFEVKASE